MDMLLVPLPRGRVAVVRFDSMTRTLSSSPSGFLAPFFTNGVKDLDGTLRFPRHGREFLAALFDYLFLNGYPVHWRRRMADSDFTATRVV